MQNETSNHHSHTHSLSHRMRQQAMEAPLSCRLLAFLFVFAAILATSHGAATRTRITGPNYGIGALNRTSFPTAFIFGTASSAYQYEGAACEDGRGPSIWDTFTHKYPGKIRDGSHGDLAIDSYHRYKEDVGIMKEMGLDAYRFSISWSRILPYGKRSMGVNRQGILYYHNLLDELIHNGMEPFVTLFHWDLPQCLEDSYGGFLSPHIVEDFREYAELCFEEYGEKVKHWITLNEPLSFSVGGYVTGQLAPGRCSQWQKLSCTAGDSATEPYLVSHHQLLAHAATVHLYRHKYQASQNGVIGITLVSPWVVPFSNERSHWNAATRALDFSLGWFMDPITNGDYPQIMRSLVGDRLPMFSYEESQMINGSYDFLGLNYYTANYAAHAPLLNSNPSYSTDSLVNLTVERNGTLIGPKAASDWLYVYPKGMFQLLMYIKRKYSNPLIYITENGVDEANDHLLSLEQALMDHMRVDYYHSHLAFLHHAIKKGANVKGYFAWSLLDNFEWSDGYTVRFGINYVDYNDGFKRHPKFSATWFKRFLQKQPN